MHLDFFLCHVLLGLRAPCTLPLQPSENLCPPSYRAGGHTAGVGTFHLICDLVVCVILLRGVSVVELALVCVLLLVGAGGSCRRVQNLPSLPRSSRLCQSS